MRQASSSDFDDNFALACGRRLRAVRGDGRQRRATGCSAIAGRRRRSQALLSGTAGAVRASALGDHRRRASTPSSPLTIPAAGRAYGSSDGTVAGTQEILFNANGVALSPTDITPNGGVVVFEGRDSDGRASLFWSDGTAAGTRELVAGLFSAQHRLAEHHRLRLSLSVRRRGRDGGSRTVDRRRLTRRDAGDRDRSARRVQPVPVAISRSSAPAPIFSAPTRQARSGVWATDGSAAGTVELVSGKQGANTLTPQNLTTYGPRLAFFGIDADDRYGVWVTNLARRRRPRFCRCRSARRASRPISRRRGDQSDRRRV